MHNKLIKLTAAVTLSLLLQGCSLFSSEDDPASPLPEFDAEFSIKEAWSTGIGDGNGDYYAQTRVLELDDTLYTASRYGVVTAVNAIDGDKVWQQDLSEQAVFNRFKDAEKALLSGGVAAGYGKIFVGSEKAVLFALDAKTGDLAWQVATDGEVIANPVVDDGVVIIQTSSGSLVGFDVVTGEQRWSHGSELPSLTLRGNNSPITTNGAAIYGRSDGKLAAVFVTNGRLIWEVAIAKSKGANDIDRLVDVNGQAIARGGDVYTSAYNGELMALELRSGNVKWKRAYASVKDIAIAGFELFITDTQGRIHAIDRRNGLTLWSQTGLSLRGVTAPTVSGSYVVVGDDDGYLHWLDRKTGNFVAQELVDRDGLFSKPLDAEELLYVQTRDGDLVAFKKPK